MSKHLAVLALSLLVSLPAFAKVDQNRQKLIQMHEKMAHQHMLAAKCLKAGKPVQECNEEAMKGCPMMKSEHCPFMHDNMTGGKSSDSMKMNQ